MPAKLTTEEFVRRAIEKHGVRYDYSTVEYRGTNQDVEIACHKHGKFSLKAARHLAGFGCQKCSWQSTADKNRLSLEGFVSRSRATHGEKYDYSLVEYINNETPVRIVCHEHGEFTQTPGNHMAGKGCRRCGRAATGVARALSAEEFVRRAREIHGDTIDLSRARYTRWEKRVLCGCKKHGDYWALPGVLLRGGKGCMECAVEERGPDRLTSEQFIDRARVVHDDRYDYSRVNYLTFLRNVEIVCAQHGPFWQTPCNHIAGKGCPKCVGLQSVPEREIVEHVRSIYDGEVQERVRSIIPPYELDIYVPEKKLAIEFNGMYWHSADKAADADCKNRHRNKREACQALGIRLIQVREDKFARRPEVVKSIIGNALGLSCRVHARKCEVTVVEQSVAAGFFDENHIDGSATHRTCLGLEINGELVAAMSFGVPRFNSTHDWELIRFASKKGMSVAGAAGRLLTHFRRQNSGSIISYCNLEHGTGRMYEAIGMRRVEMISMPNYVWVKNGRVVYTRYQTQKHKLNELLLNFDETKSEAENMFAHGFRRYWDSGSAVYVMS